jgi:hypothetical protein
MEEGRFAAFFGRSKGFGGKTMIWIKVLDWIGNIALLRSEGEH